MFSGFLFFSLGPYDKVSENKQTAARSRRTCKYLCIEKKNRARNINENGER